MAYIDTEKKSFIDLSFDASAIKTGVFDPDRIPTITRDKLEYPTVDISFAYLQIIDKLLFQYTNAVSYGEDYRVATEDTFTDKLIATAIIGGNQGCCCGRMYNFTVDTTLRCFTVPSATTGLVAGMYQTAHVPGATTADHVLRRCDASPTAGTTNLATEAVDVNSAYTYIYALSISGSTLKSFRTYANYSSNTPQLTATDTTYASGMWGIELCDPGKSPPTFQSLVATFLRSPLTQAPRHEAIIEVESFDFPRKLKEILKVSNLPSFLIEEAKKYDILKKRGFTDEEIKTLLGYIPQTQIDTLAVTWGSFDYKGEETAIVTIRKGSMDYLDDNAVLENKKHAKKKGLKAWTIKDDKAYIEKIFKEIRKERPEMIAGKHNFLYQVFGYQDFEPLAVLDFYHGAVVEGIYGSTPFKRVRDSELRRTLEMWKNRCEKSRVSADEKKKHLEKYKEIERVGW